MAAAFTMRTGNNDAVVAPVDVLRRLGESVAEADVYTEGKASVSA